MRKLFATFVFFAITGMMTACGESPVDVPVGVLEIASEIECDEGNPDPNSFLPNSFLPNIFLCEFGGEG